MDYHLKGHPYVKAGIDTACWDILGKVCLSSAHPWRHCRFNISLHTAPLSVWQHNLHPFGRELQVWLNYQTYVKNQGENM